MIQQIIRKKKKKKKRDREEMKMRRKAGMQEMANVKSYMITDAVEHKMISSLRNKMK